MSNEKHAPLLSDERILNDVKLTVRATPNRIVGVKDLPLTAFQVRDIYEADRAKTREVVQALVDALERTLDPTSFAMTQARLPITEHEYRRALQQGNQAIALAKSQLNISPTKP